MPAAVEMNVAEEPELVLDEELEKVQMRQRGGFRLRDATRQGLDHARQAQMAEARG